MIHDAEPGIVITNKAYVQIIIRKIKPFGINIVGDALVQFNIDTGLFLVLLEIKPVDKRIRYAKGLHPEKATQ
jgi:hypothetical protein